MEQFYFFQNGPCVFAGRSQGHSLLFDFEISQRIEHTRQNITLVHIVDMAKIVLVFLAEPFFLVFRFGADVSEFKDDVERPASAYAFQVFVVFRCEFNPEFIGDFLPRDEVVARSIYQHAVEVEHKSFGVHLITDFVLPFSLTVSASAAASRKLTPLVMSAKMASSWYAYLTNGPPMRAFII